MKKALVLLFVVLVLNACSLFRPKMLPYPEGIVFPLKVAHEVEFEGEIIAPLSQQSGMLFFSTRKGYVYCMDAASREEAWKFQADTEIESSVHLGKENLYVYDRVSTLYCLGMEGRLLWKKTIGGDLTSGVCEGPDQVFIGTEAGRFFSLSQADGRDLWNHQAEGALRAGPVFVQGKVIFGSDDHRLYVLSPNGNLLGKFQAEDKIQGRFLVDQRELYFGSDDHHFYCFDLSKLKLKWKVKTGGKVHAQPVSDKKRIFFLGMNNVIYCLNKENGTILWWANIPSRSFFRPEVIDDRIAVSALSARLVCFDIETGRLIGEHTAPREIRSNPMWVKPFLVFTQHDFGSGTGKLLFMERAVYVTLSPSRSSPLMTNEEVIFTAAAAGFHLPQYEFYFRRYIEVRCGWISSILFQVEDNTQARKEKSEENTWSWFPERPGVYVIGVKATDGREEAAAEVPFLVQGSEQK